MRTTAIFSYKGGVGKTTTAINLGAELAAHGKRVLLIDVDGQRNTSTFFHAGMDGATIYDLLIGSEPLYSHLTQRTRWENLDILPSSENLATIELQALQDQRYQLRLDALFGFRETLTYGGEYDYVLIDCPPSFAPQSVAALAAADDVVVPVTLDNFAISGLRDLNVSISGAWSVNKRLRIAGILITMADKSAVSRDAEAALRASGYPVYQQTIRHSAYARRMTFDSGPLRDFCPLSGIARDYGAFTTEYLGGVSNG